MTRSIHCNSQLINSIHLGSGLKSSILFYFEPSQLQFSQMLWKGHFKAELMSPLVKMAYKENRHFHVRCFLPRIESFQPHFMKYLWNGSKKWRKMKQKKKCITFLEWCEYLLLRIGSKIWNLLSEFISEMSWKSLFIKYCKYANGSECNLLIAAPR